MQLVFKVYAILANKKYFKDILKTCKGLELSTDKESGDLTISFTGERKDFHQDCAELAKLAFEKKFRPVKYVPEDDTRIKWYEKDLMPFLEKRAREDVFFGALRRAAVAYKETGTRLPLPDYEKSQAIKPYAKCVADLVSGKSFNIIGAEYSKDELAKARELIAVYGIKQAA